MSAALCATAVVAAAHALLTESDQGDCLSYVGTEGGDLNQDDQGWKTGSSSYFVGDEARRQFASAYGALPAPLDQSVSAIHLFAMGPVHVDSWRQVSGLTPGGRYDATFVGGPAASGLRYGAASWRAGFWWQCQASVRQPAES
jgi:hypothetical protein